MEVPDNQTSITLRRPRGDSFLRHLFDNMGHTTLIGTFDDEYRMVIHTDPPDRYGEAHPHVSRHPDGSVFFEWTEKRGTRIER
jgi:hypothetical protein